MGIEIKTKAIVTHSIAYHEADMLVTLVSPEFGKITAVAKGCLKPKAKLRYASEILNFGDYILSEKSGKYVIIDCSQIEPFINITYDIERFYAASMILNALEKLSKEPQASIFVFALESLNKLANGEDINDVIKEFLLFILHDGGTRLDFNHCNSCGCDLVGDCYYKEDEGIICKDCKVKDGYFIDKISREYFIGKDIPYEIKKRANRILIDIVDDTIGIKIDTQYFTETFL